MKVDLYSDLHNCLEGWILIREALILHELIEERLEGGGDANDNTIDESPISLSEYLGLLQEIKGILGGDFHTDIWQDLSDRSLMNLPFDEIESLSEVEIKARIKKAMDDSFLDLIRWFSEVFNRVNRNMSQLFVMDSQHVARKIHALGNLFLFTLDERGHAGVRDMIMSVEDDQRIRQLRAMTSDIYAHLLKDLDETL
ncbi:MAG: hypothetical protein KAR39_10165 [Thermoplasmata archaeon]|nr:hypothetical protein [Thermoplasmata archaeon]